MPYCHPDAHWVVLGLGETGFSVIEYAIQHGLSVSVADTRAEPPREAECRARFPKVHIYTGGLPRAVLSTATHLIVSPGLPLTHPEIAYALQSGIPVFGDIELFAVLAKAPVIAITGSNGKSTVTSWVGEMAQKASIRVGIGGNLGTPALSLLNANAELYILELSSFQLETTYSLKPKASAILNVSADHFDRYASFEAYAMAKKRIYEGASHRIYNREDPWTYPPESSSLNTLSFGLDTPLIDQYGLLQQGSDFLAKGQEALLPLSDLKLFGRHNIANALAALALAEAAGIPREAQIEALRTFTGLSHRCEWVRTLKGIPWINDSKGTNVGATYAALEGLSSDIQGQWILIAGGVGKNADFIPLQSLVAKHCRAVILMGEAAPELEALLQDHKPCYRVASLEEAVHQAHHLAREGDGVLLSPACASFDMFAHYAERGDRFKALVHAL